MAPEDIQADSGPLHLEVLQQMHVALSDLDDLIEDYGQTTLIFSHCELYYMYNSLLTFN